VVRCISAAGPRDCFTSLSYTPNPSPNLVLSCGPQSGSSVLKVEVAPKLPRWSRPGRFDSLSNPEGAEKPPPPSEEASGSFCLTRDPPQDVVQIPTGLFFRLDWALVPAFFFFFF